MIIHFLAKGLSNFHKNTGTASYKCLDSICAARGTINIKSNNNDISNNFILKKNHSLDYEDHSYIRRNAIKKDLENLSKIEINKKMKNYKYLEGV